MAVVLVVDDEPLQCDILKTILDAEKHETYTATSGAEAMKLSGRVLPDVILTDLKMQGMDGIELLERIPEEPFKPSIIIMTAHGTISSAVEAVKKGACDYLTKPLQKESLLLTVRRAAERTRLLKENLRLTSGSGPPRPTARPHNPLPRNQFTMGPPRSAAGTGAAVGFGVRPAAIRGRSAPPYLSPFTKGRCIIGGIPLSSRHAPWSPPRCARHPAPCDGAGN